MGLSKGGRALADRAARTWLTAMFVVGSGGLASACTWFDEDPFEERVREDFPTPILVELKIERLESCRDGLVPVMTESWTRYNRAVTRGRRASDRDRYFGVHRHNFRGCKVALADGLLMKPPMPELEAAASAFVEIAKDYAQRSRRRGRADETTKAKDARLERDYARWESARETLDLLIDRVRTQNGPALLESLQSITTELGMHARAVHVDARPLVDCLLQEPAPVAQVCEPFLEAFEGHYAVFIEQYESGAGRGAFWLDSYAATARAFREEVLDAMKNLRERRLGDGDRQRLQRTHRDLLRDAKTLRFRFP